MEKDLKKLQAYVAESTKKLVDQEHTVIDSLILITATLVSFGNENGMVTYISRQFTRTEIKANKWLERYIDDRTMYRYIKERLVLCEHIFTQLDDYQYVSKNPIGYGG